MNTPVVSKSTELSDFTIAGGGEMGELMRAIDWGATPVGPVSSWPLSLKTAIRILLECKLPMYIAWGDEYTQFYNDAYRPILGDKHPRAMGANVTETWSEIWPTIGPMWAEVKQGKSIGFDDFMLTIERFGYPEDCYFNFSYSPVPNDDGVIAGVLVTFAETTQKVLVEQRQAFHLDVANALTKTTNPQGIIAIVSEKLGNTLKAARVGYGEIDTLRDTVFVARDWTDGKMSSLAGEERPLAGFGPNIIEVLRSGQTLQLDDIAADPRSAPYADGYASIMTKSLVVVPLIREKKLMAILYVHEPSPRRWTPKEITLIEEVAIRTWADVERARIEEVLHGERERSHQILQGMAEGFVLLDFNFHVVQINQEALRYETRPAEQIVGKSHWEAWPGTEHSELGQLYKRAMATRSSASLEHLYSFPDSRAKWFEVNAYPVKEGLALFYRDVTQRKTIEEALRTANRRKDEFLAMLAHELRNPLAPISAAADLLKLPIGEAGIKKTSDIITRQVRHMTGLIDDLLDVSRVTRGLVKLDKTPIEIKDVLAHAVEQVRPLVESKKHQLTVELAREAVHVTGDEKRLVQVITNLLNNSAKYTPEGGNIVLRLAARDHSVVVSVTDDGIGMASDLVESAFDLFVQAQRTSDRSQGGLGLGLALVKSIVELHGGTVRAVSEGIGKGTTLTVTLPRLSGYALTPPPSQRENPTGTPLVKALSVLIVDDNQDAAQTLSMYLEAMGHNVDVAHHGIVAIERASAKLYDVCILDIGLPDMDGFEIAHRIKGIHARAPLLIAVTGYGAVEDQTKGESAGFIHCMVKPVNNTVLASLLVSHV